MESLIQQLRGKLECIPAQELKYLTHIVDSEQSTVVQKITHVDKQNVTV